MSLLRVGTGINRALLRGAQVTLARRRTAVHIGGIASLAAAGGIAALLRSPRSLNDKNDRVSGRFRSFDRFVPEDNRR